MIDQILTVDTSQLKDVENRLGDFSRAAPKLIARAINESAAKGKTQLVKSITEVYAIKASDVKDTLSIKKASPGDTVAEIRSKGGSIILSKFKYSISSRGNKIAKAKVKKASNLKRILGMFAINSNQTWLVIRKSNEKRDLKFIYGVPVPYMANEKTLKSVWWQVNQTYPERLEHAINRELSKGGN